MQVADLNFDHPLVFWFEVIAGKISLRVVDHSPQVLNELAKSIATFFKRYVVGAIA